MATITGFTSDRMLAIENSTVVSGTIIGDNLVLLTRDGTEIEAGNVRGPQGVVGPPGDVTLTQLNDAIAAAHADGSITNNQLATGSVTTNKLATGSVTSEKLATAAVTSAAIATNAVLSANIQAAAVGVTQLASGAVTTVKIAADAVTADKVAANAITNTAIGTNAVTEEKIGSLAVSTRTLASSSVTTDKIANANVTEAKLATAVLSSPGTDIAYNTGWILPTNGLRRIRYKKVGNLVYVYGAARKSGAGGSSSVCNLPSGFRPSVTASGGAASGQTEAFVALPSVPVRIDAAGWVTLYDTVNDATYGINFVFEI